MKIENYQLAGEKLAQLKEAEEQLKRLEKIRPSLRIGIWNEGELNTIDRYEKEDKENALLINKYIAMKKWRIRKLQQSIEIL